MGRYGQVQEIPEGQYTAKIYTLINDKKYDEVIRILTLQLQGFPKSRAALSLLGYSYYMIQDFANATAMYDQLVKLQPNVEEYKFYKAQCLYKDGKYAEANVAAGRVEGEAYQQRIVMLQAAIVYEQNELGRCKALAEKCNQDDPEVR